MCYTTLSIKKCHVVWQFEKWEKNDMTEGGLLIFLACIILLCIIAVVAAVVSSVSGTMGAIEDDEESVAEEQ